VSGPTIEQTGEPGGEGCEACGMGFSCPTHDPRAAAEERGFNRGVREAGSGPALAAVRAEAEWRGAEKERERLAGQLRREAHPWYDAQTRMLELADRWAAS
jgi:hypothetical protein